MVNPSALLHFRWNWFLPAITLASLITLALAILLISSASVAEATVSVVPAAPGSISGRVVNEAGVGLTDIDILLYRGEDFYETYRTQSDTTGNYLLPGLAPGVYTLLFYDQRQQFHSEYYNNVLARDEAKALVIAGNQLSGIDATLELGGAITGTVTLAVGQSDYRDIILYYRRPAAPPLLVQSAQFALQESTYQFAGLWPGDYYLCAHAIFHFDGSRYFDETEKCFDNLLTANPAASTPIKVVGGQTVGPFDFVMDERADRITLAATVLTSAGTPISDTLVSLYRDNGNGSAEVIRTTVSDDQGIALFPFLEAQPYTLTFADRSDQWLYIGQTLNANGDYVLPVDTSAVVDRQQIPVTMTAAAQITGVVTFYGSAAPMRGTVRAYSDHYGPWYEERSTDLDAAGYYTLTGLYPRSYRVSVEAVLGGSSGQNTFYGGDSVESATDIVLTPGEVRRNINWNLTVGPFDSVISGTVTAGNVPLPGIRVELWLGYPEGAQFVVYTLTDGQGRYRIEGLPESYYYIRFADPQQRYAVTYLGGTLTMGGSKSVHTDGTNQLANIDGHMIVGGAVQGTVRRYDGTPVANAIVGAHFPPGSGASDWAQEEIIFKTNASGVYLITGLLPGFYRIGFAEEGARYPSAEFYDAANSFQNATDVPVKAGKVTAGIDLILGPDHYLWLPYLAR